MKPYSLRWGGSYLNYGKWLWRPREAKYFEQPKILFIRLRNKALRRKLVGAYDDSKYYNRDNFNNIILKDQSYSLKFVLALFNSSVLNFWYRAYFDNVNINPAQVSLLPFRTINFDDPGEKAMHDRVERLVEQMIGAKKSLADARTDKDREFYERFCEKLDRDIDDLVYQLYDITPEERKNIEGSVICEVVFRYDNGGDNSNKGDPTASKSPGRSSRSG